MTRVACTLMQKNEALLIEPWLIYHGYMFGFENLYVWDNGSTNNSVIETLQRFESAGVNVAWDRTSLDDFHYKGGVIGTKVHEFRDQGRYDLVIPLDCDEFVAMSGARGLSTNRSEILTYLSKIHGKAGAPQMMWGYHNWPGHLDLFKVEEFDKAVIPVNDFDSIDAGFHFVKLSSTGYKYRSELSYIHLHHKPLSALQFHAAAKLDGRVDIKDPDALAAYLNSGAHLPRFFSMTEESYCDTIRNPYPLARTGVLMKTFAALGCLEALQERWEISKQIYASAIGDSAVIDIDGTYDRQTYLRLNPDLLKPIVDPLAHYIRHGVGEGRRALPGG